MAGVPTPEYQQFWTDQRSALKTEYKDIVKSHPDAALSIQHLHKVLCDIEALAGCTPASVVESEEWAAVVRSAEHNRESFCKALSGKHLFSALYGTYTVTLNELKTVLKASSQAGQTKQADGFQVVRSRKRHSTGEARPHSQKGHCRATSREGTYQQLLRPSREAHMDTDAPAESNTEEAAAPGKSSRPPPILLTSAGNLIQLQKQLKGVPKQPFEFRNTKNGTRVVTKDVVDYLVVKSFFNQNSLSYFTFFPKSEKPIKAVLRHLPSNTPAQDISERLVDLGFDVISVKQMSSTRRSPDGSKPVNLPLFLVTLRRTHKSPEIFKLSSLCYISMKVEAYKSQNTLTQCYNFQKFGHVWANCKQPPRCM
jgi:hypothetical protein